MRNLMLTYPRIEDPQPIAGGATSNQLPRNQLEAGAARAGVVADNVDNLVVAQAFVGKALVMKRWQPRARGRVGRIQKPFSNLTIVVREVEEAA